MDIAGVEKGLIGMALFDMYEKAVRKAEGGQKCQGDPLVAAAGQAFEAYVQSVEVSNSAMIAGLSTYALSPNGAAANLVSIKEQAPFLALNVMA